jgi:hypothetical protein
MAAKIIPQTFTKGSTVTIHPCYTGRLPVGIQRNKRYMLTNSTENQVVFVDDHGFTRVRPLYQFVQVAP